MRDAELRRVASEDPSALRDLILQSEYAAPDSHGRCYRVRKLMVTVLDELDSSGRLLLDVACNSNAAWYTRVAAIDCLGKRGDSDLLRQIVAVLHESNVETEITSAAVSAFAENRFAESLPDIQLLSKRLGDDCLLLPRCILGDADALRPLILQAFGDDTWPTERDELLTNWPMIQETLGGKSNVLGILAGSRIVKPIHDWAELLPSAEPMELRRFALDRFLAGEPDSAETMAQLVPLLSDSSELMAADAGEALLSVPEPFVDELYEIATDPSGPVEARLRSVYILLRRGRDVQELLSGIPDWRVPLPELVPASVRQSIVRFWVPQCEPGTDVRWLIESLLLPPAATSDDERLAIWFRAELHARDWQASAPVDYADVVQQGTSTYRQMRATPPDGSECQVAISGFGPFAASDEPSEDSSFESRCAAIASAVGYTWFGREVLDVEFSGLYVYHFGERRPLPIGQLLFYWQD